MNNGEDQQRPWKSVTERVRGFHVLIVIGVAFLAVRSILDSEFRNSTLLYLVVPFGISILLSALTQRSQRAGIGWRYLNHLRDATIVFLATSAILFEGFVCVLMFMPIYYLIVTVGFLFSLLSEWQRTRRDARIGAVVIPAVLLTLSMEGLAAPVTVQRYSEGTYSLIVEGSIAELQANMAKPIAFEAERRWFLSVFPLPDKVEAGTLGVGDVHRLSFTYKKWFVTNFHHGDMLVRIAEVSRHRIRTEITDDSSYLSHYMRIEGTEVLFDEVSPGRTRVTLTVKYNRLLDPYWYFGPMENFAAEQSAKYLIQTIVERRI